MPKIAIAVEFKIKDGQHAAFDALVDTVLALA